MSIRNSATGSRANSRPAGGGYGYRGAPPIVVPSVPAKPPRKTPGPRPDSVSGRVLQALADLGGEATTTDIRQALEASGFPVSARHVATALKRMAEMSPPRVTASGDGRGGYRRARRWRLLGAAAAGNTGQGGDAA